MKKQVGQLLLTLAQTSRHALIVLGQGMKQAAASISSYYAAKHRNVQLANQQLVQQLLEKNKFDIANAVRWGLFCAFSTGSQYPYLAPIHEVNDIVIYSTTQFGIALKSTDSVPPAYGLRQIAGHMNADIRDFRQKVLMYHPQWQAWNDYPFLMAGAYVDRIDINGAYAVLTLAFPPQ